MHCDDGLGIFLILHFENIRRSVVMEFAAPRSSAQVTKLNLSVSPRMKLRTRSGKGRMTALDAPKRLRERRNRFGRVIRIQTDEVGRSSDRDAIIFEAHQPCRGTGDHIEAASKVCRSRHMANIGIEVSHPDQRAVTIRGERVQDIVGRDRAGQPAFRNGSAGTTPRGTAWS